VVVAVDIVHLTRIRTTISAEEEMGNHANITSASFAPLRATIYRLSSNTQP
jgi:hypothetical protein